MAAARAGVAMAAAADRLSAGIAAMQLDLSASQQSRLLDFLDLLHKWGGAFNLTAVLDPLEMVTLHLLDSLSILPLVKRHGPQTMIDIGSGAGLPGIPLAIAMPAVEIVLVDSVQKKTAFQTQAKGALKLDNCRPVNGRVQALTFKSPFDVAVCRAFASIEDATRLSAPVLRPHGRLIAMKGAVPKAELETLESAWRLEDVEPLSVFGLDARRCAVILEHMPLQLAQSPGRIGAHG